MPGFQVLFFKLLPYTLKYYQISPLCAQKVVWLIWYSVVIHALEIHKFWVYIITIIINNQE